MQKVDEVIEELLERMKEPGLAKSAFDELAARVRTLQGLTEKR